VPADAGEIPKAQGARLGGDAKRTRFVTDLTAPVRFNAYVLADPYRVVIDLAEVNFQLPEGIGEKGRGLVKAYRYGLISKGKSRIVMDATGPVLIEKSFSIGPENGQPARLVVDLVPTTPSTFALLEQRQKAERTEQLREADTELDSLPAETDEEPSSEAPSRSAAVNVLRDMAESLLSLGPSRQTDDLPHEPQRRTIVIDPGHGGIDPGALGRHGTTEKSVVLAFATELKAQLDSGRYHVTLTREDDTFLTLKDRVKFAREQKADLFIAIHADAVRNTPVRGATVYTLSDTASDDEAEALAHSQNRSDLIAGVDLGEESDEITGILIDLAQRESKNHAIHFAKSVVGRLKPMIELTSRPVRSAGFRVLKAPDVPSVLLELGYLSNPADEKLLRSEAWRRKVAKAVASAVNVYFGDTLAAGQ
jgi:N-acetylmuramoyl-L-alanine amidase